MHFSGYGYEMEEWILIASVADGPTVNSWQNVLLRSYCGMVPQ